MLTQLRKFARLPPLDPQIWILSAGRLLSAIGTGFTLFYAPIFFVNQVGLSATAVGLGLGSASISGIVGRILGGTFADTPTWGRRRTLLLSAAISAIAALILAFADNLPSFVCGNLVMGLGAGLYWPPNEALVADLSPTEQRSEAYAVTRLSDSIGLGLGVVLGGAWISLFGEYRSLFVIDAVSFAVFLVVIARFIKESAPARTDRRSWQQSWGAALGDRRLLVYVLVNILITSYIAQINTTLPLYFTNFVGQGKGFNSATLSALFTWHLVLAVILQLPLARWLNRWSRPQALILSSGLWGLGFGLVAVTGIVPDHALIWAIVSLAVLAIATVVYTPSASALVADLAPEALRGVYLSINSLCWAVGFFIGPSLGGLMLDQPRPWADGLWLGLTMSVAGAIVILHYLNRLLFRTDNSL
ncbi:MAG: MFS transporter [Aphanocapsa sp. GSE-SYN-MK-11-07L]|jgi:MFS family permease|nr:MFS transporter [Aphanocapsa sp. GSE-SYN-MK-11-07L]